MSHPAAADLRILDVSDTTALALCGADDFPPTLCPELVPAGYRTTGEVLDFRIGGVWVEAYLLAKEKRA